MNLPASFNVGTPRKSEVPLPYRRSTFRANALGLVYASKIDTPGRNLSNFFCNGSMAFLTAAGAVVPNFAMSASTAPSGNGIFAVSIYFSLNLLKV